MLVSVFTLERMEAGEHEGTSEDLPLPSSGFP